MDDEVKKINHSIAKLADDAHVIFKHLKDHGLENGYINSWLKDYNIAVAEVAKDNTSPTIH
jgi:hypothetical protein